MSKVLKSALSNDLEKEYHELDGLYFSNISLQIFEAKLHLPQYCQVHQNQMKKFNDGDRVYCYYFGKIINGTIHKNVEFPKVSKYYIKYDDGEECAVLDINQVYKLNQDNQWKLTKSLRYYC